MLGEHLKIQSRVNSDYTDEQLLLIKEMGIKYVYVIFSDEDSNYALYGQTGQIWFDLYRCRKCWNL